MGRLQAVLREAFYSEEMRRLLRLWDAFWDFHVINPTVYDELVELARDARRAGFEHYSIDIIWCVMRHHRNLAMLGGDEFKLNNNHRAYYARMIMRLNPDLSDLFEIRRVEGEHLIEEIVRRWEGKTS